MNKQDKLEKYHELIKDVIDDYCEPKNARNRTKHGVTVEWTEVCKKHINLWSYWQGSLNAKIMVVGQDWGHFSAYDVNPKDVEKYKVERKILTNLEEINNGKDSRYYKGIDIYKSKVFLTDRNLVELFRALGEEVGETCAKFENIVENKYDELFFTNLCLGYRNSGSSGEMLQSWLSTDFQYFERLYHIIQPEVILCLGKCTYDTIAATMCKEPERKKFTYERLEGKENYFDISDGKMNCRVFGLAHPGGMGMANRKTQLEEYKESKISGMELQKKDWKNVGRYLALK